jgi:hypothetical protein
MTGNVVGMPAAKRDDRRDWRDRGAAMDTRRDALMRTLAVVMATVLVVWPFVQIA